MELFKLPQKRLKFRNVLLLSIYSFFLLNLIACNEKNSYELSNSGSSVSFSTIKLEYVVEPAYFKNISGKIDEKGNLNISIDLNSIDTGISIRDQRLQKLFFDTSKFANVEINTQIDMKTLKSKTNVRENLDVQVTFNGQTKTIKTEVITHAIDGKIISSSAKPIIINASDFDIPSQNLIALAKTMGGISISDIVPVNFTLYFE